MPGLARKAEGRKRLRHLHGMYRRCCQRLPDERTCLRSSCLSALWTAYDWESMSHQTWLSNPYPWKILLIIVLFTKLFLLPTKVRGDLGLRAAVGWGLIIKSFLMIVTSFFFVAASHGQSKDRTLPAASPLFFPTAVHYVPAVDLCQKILSWIFEFVIDFIFDFTVLDH